jgi:hypothetical protein
MATEALVGLQRRASPPVWNEPKHKWELKVTTHDGPAALDHWRQHLANSEFSLSIIPLLDNGKCLFACIDCDEYELEYPEICQRIYRLKFPLIACVSKSCGLHLFVFFKELVPAELVIPALRVVAGDQGRPGERLTHWFYWVVGLVAGTLGQPACHGWSPAPL